MSNQDKPRRRWFRFSLGTLFWLTLVTGLCLFALNERRERKLLETQVRVLVDKLERHPERAKEIIRSPALFTPAKRHH